MCEGVVAVNEVVSDPWMIWLARQNAIQNLSRFLLPGIALVICHHPRRDERQRIEDAGFTV